MRVLLRTATALFGISVLVALFSHYGPTGAANAQSSSAQTPPGPPVLDSKASIVPCVEDFTADLASRIRFPRRGDKSTGNFLRPWGPTDRLINTIVAGRGAGPTSRRLGEWSSDIRYVIYKTPEDARFCQRAEDYWRQLTFGPGSFSGARIGDTCGKIAQPANGFYELHFVRHNVSVTVGGSVGGPSEVVDKNGRVADLTLDPTEREALRPEIEEAMEAAANAIVRRIDRIVKAKGTVEMSNLPPVKAFPPESGSAPTRSGTRPAPTARATLPPPPPAPIDGKLVITPSVEDFVPALTEKISFPRRSNTSRLTEVAPYIHMVDTIGGGTVPGQGSSRIRFILYRTPEDAKANWESEDHTRPDKCVAGSFSGEQIGDACRHVANSDHGQYDLGFIRGRVSVYIAWEVQAGQPARDQALRESGLEQTAKVILNRIDGVVKSKGYVDMSNLPKFLPRLVPSEPVAPPPPPPWKTK